ncbi:MAG: hypothetical protein AB7R77_08600 [Ilumatobacteraceae bacterium]
MTDPNGEQVQRVTLYFDPACPWTWRTSRWLVGAATTRGVPVEYAALELTAGADVKEVPSERRAAAAASRMFLRGVTAARAEGRHDLIGRWYTLFGTSRWDDHAEPTGDLVRNTLVSAGGDDLFAALDDAGLDDPMAASRSEALDWAGDDVGSPVTVWDLGEHRRGFFGPVVAPKPVGSESDTLWEAVRNLVVAPDFFEIKARRTHDPVGASGESHS